jgi:hypothetical protein
MRLRLLGALVLCLSLAAVARAETQVFQATFTFAGLVDPPPSDTAVGVATVNGSGGGLHLATLQLPGDILSLHTDVPVTGGTLPITQVQIDLTLAGGVFDVGAGGTLSGPLPVQGIARLCVALGCGINFDVPLTAGGTRGVGIGGAAIDVPLGGFGSLALLGMPWETGTASITTPGGSTLAVAGFAHGPLSNTSSTASPLGEMLMVTPVRVGAVIGGNPEQVLPLFGILEVKLLPEPGATTTLAAGAALLAALGVRRGRRR